MEYICGRVDPLTMVLIFHHCDNLSHKQMTPNQLKNLQIEFPNHNKLQPNYCGLFTIYIHFDVNSIIQSIVMRMKLELHKEVMLSLSLTLFTDANKQIF